MKNPTLLDHGEIATINSLPSAQFKNFCLTFLAALGLSHIESVSIAGCGCVAGKGSIELGILMTYHFAFLGKQHNGIVPEEVIDAIRNVMEDRTRKGIILTTGSFSRQAKRQAKIKGKVPIDLIDGNSLIHRLKDKQLRISIETGEVFPREKGQL